MWRVVFRAALLLTAGRVARQVFAGNETRRVRLTGAAAARLAETVLMADMTSLSCTRKEFSQFNNHGLKVRLEELHLK